MANDADDIIKKLKDEYDELKSALPSTWSPSTQLTIDDVFRKTILLSVASHHEHQITAMLSNFYVNNCSNAPFLVEFVKNQALNRKYHTLFAWDGNNANKFFSLFGNEFKIHMTCKIKKMISYKNL